MGKNVAFMNLCKVLYGVCGALCSGFMAALLIGMACWGIVWYS